MSNRVLMCIFALSLTLQGAESSSSRGRAMLSNDKIRAEINLDQGGQISALYDQRTGTVLSDAAGGKCSLFTDSLFDKGNYFKVDNIYQRRKFEVVALTNGTTATVTVRSPKGLPLDITKTYALQDGSDVLTVSYEVTNPGEKDFIGALYLSSGFRIPDESQYHLYFPEGYFNSGNNGWIPGSKLVKNHFLYEPGKTSSRDLFIHNPIRDYVFLAGRKTGVMFQFPFPYLDFFYTHCSPRADGSASVGFFTAAFQLPPLSKGKKEADLLAVMKDPLAAYKYRFAISVRFVNPANFSYEQYREPSKEKKSDAFIPRIEGEKMNIDFKTPAIIRERTPLRKIKLAAIAVAHGNPEMGELNRRLKTEMSLVDTSNANSFRPTQYFGWKMPQPEMALQPILEKKPDIILINGHPEHILPAVQRKKLFELVKNGASLIFVSESNGYPSLVSKNSGMDLPEGFFAGMLKERLPVLGPVKVYPYGKGKMIHVRFPMNALKISWLRESRAVIPYAEKQPENFPYWEYYFSFYGKLFRYAAGIHSPASIRDIKMENGNAELDISADGAISSAVVSLILDTPAGRLPEKVLWRGTLKPGRNKLKLALPAGTVFQSGEYRCFFSLDSTAGTLDWFDTAFTHRGPAGIHVLSTDRKTFKENEPVTGKIVLEGCGTLVVKLREGAAGRVVAKTQIPDAHGTQRFSLKRELGSTEKLYRVEAEIHSPGGIAATARQNVLISPNLKSREKILPLIWGPHLMSWRDRVLAEELGDMGFRIFISPLSLQKSAFEFQREAEDVYSWGMEYASLGFEHIKSARSKRLPYVDRVPCLRNPQYHKRLKDRAAAICARLKNALSDICFISDEISLGYFFDLKHDFCFSPFCLTAFRKALEKKYNGDLEQLNRNWQTRFTCWQEVRPDTREEAARRKNYVSTQEHRLFMMENMTLACRTLVDEVKRIYPVKVGISGMGFTSVYMGFDLLKSMSYMECSALYITPFVIDLARSSMTEAHITGAYTDYGARYKIWSQLIGGLRTPAVWWYGQLFRRGDANLSQEGLLLKEMFARIRNSAASHVFGEGQRKNGPLTLVWSTPSLVAAEITRTGNPVTKQIYEKNLNSWSQLICDLGMDMANVIAADELNKISPATHPVVILPCVLRLSDEQIRHLENYVSSGGTLIADLYPGKFDDFGMERQNNPLYSLFGISHMKNAVHADSSYHLGGHSVSKILWGNELAITADTQVGLPVLRGNGGLKLGGMMLSHQVAPAVLIRKFGKGKTLYLNFALYEYDHSDSAADSGSRGPREIMARVFALAGLDMKNRHELPPGSSFAEYRLGNIRYLFLSRRAGKSEGKFRLKFGKTTHIYDMFAGKYLGTSDFLNGKLPDNGVCFTGLFPEKLGRFTGKIDFDGRKIRIQAERKHPDFQEPLRLRIFHNGREIQFLSETRMLSDRLQWEVDLGLEPAPGTWQVSLTAVADSRKLEKRFNIAK